jgi:hypothetical protein
MTTTNEREALIAAAETAYRAGQNREANFRAYMCAHLGPEAGTQQAEEILAANDPKQLSDEQLNLSLYFKIGLPPGYTLTEEQLDRAIEDFLSAHGG